MISKALAQIVDAADREVSSAAVIAPLSHGPSILAVTWAGLDRVTDESIDAPAGVSVLSWIKPADHYTLLPALTSPERNVLEAAWQWGAWDVLRTCHAPHPCLPVPPVTVEIAPLLRAQGYVAWSWRPMMRGPEIRIKAHAAKDVTLEAITYSRAGDCPDVRVPMITPGRQHVIKLGKSAAARGPAPGTRGYIPPATPRQMTLLRALRREQGITGTLPALNIRQASDQIDALRRQQDGDNNDNP